jgi:hypothetical protein
VSARTGAGPANRGGIPVIAVLSAASVIVALA